MDSLPYPFGKKTTITTKNKIPTTEEEALDSREGIEGGELRIVQEKFTKP